MQFNERQRLILLGVLKDQHALMNMPIGTEYGYSRDQVGRRRLAMRDAQTGYIPMNLSVWLGHAVTNSDAVLAHREYARMEAMGLLHRHNLRGGTRTSHLKLTALGKRAAEAILAEEPPIATSQDLQPLEDGVLDLDWSGIEMLEAPATTAP